jgi:parallel beta-helix repeat protein
MSRRLVLMLFLLVSIGVIGISVKVNRAWAIEKIYILSDGSIMPSDAPIQRNGDVYTLTDNINSVDDGIQIDRNNMTLDGAGHTVQGSGSNFAVYLPGNSNITIRNMVIQSFMEGIYLSNSSNVSLRSNTITGISEEGIYLYSSSNCGILDNEIAASAGGVFLGSSSDNNVSGNTITSCDYGLNIQHSPDCNFSSNSIRLSNQFGMWLYNSTGSNVSQNNITGNAIGIELNYSPLCIIYENQIASNQYAISFVFSLQNRIFHNNFDQNAQLFKGLQGTNTWDDGYPSGGNYWSGYNGLDLYSGPGQNLTGSDGIGDSALVLDPQIAIPQNIDHYPLMTPHVIPEFHPVLILLLLMLATLLIVAVYRKRTLR